MIDLDELRKKAEVATKGPWYADEDVVTARDGTDYVQGYNITCPSGDVIGMDGILGHHGNNAYFIAAANPSVVLELIDRVERVEAKASRLANNAIASAECAKLYERDVEECIIKPRDAEITRLRALLARVGEALSDAIVEIDEAADKMNVFGLNHPGSNVYRGLLAEQLGEDKAAMKALSARFWQASVAARTVAAEIEKEIRND